MSCPPRAEDAISATTIAQRIRTTRERSTSRSGGLQTADQTEVWTPPLLEFTARNRGLRFLHEQQSAGKRSDEGSAAEPARAHRRLRNSGADVRQMPRVPEREHWRIPVRQSAS